MIEGATQLRTADEVDAFLDSHPRAVVFKAGGCGQTDWALVAVRRALSAAAGLPVGVVTVIEARAASDRVTERSGVRHESPQILLFEGGSAVFHRSHAGISETSLAEGLLRLRAG